MVRSLVATALVSTLCACAPVTHALRDEARAICDQAAGAGRDQALAEFKDRHRLKSVACVTWVRIEKPDRPYLGYGHSCKPGPFRIDVDLPAGCERMK